MNRQRVLTFAAIIGMQSILAAQVEPPKGKTAPSPTYPAPVAQKADPALVQLTDAYQAAFNTADTQGIGALYTEDALRVTPDGQFLTGREAITKSYAEAFAGPLKGAGLTLRPGTTRTLTPDVALIEGTYEVAGGRGPTRGRYVNTVVRRGGQWRLASVVTLPEMTAPK